MAGKLFVSKSYWSRIRANTCVKKRIMKQILFNDSYLPVSLYNIKHDRSHSITKTKSRCILSNRSKATFNKFRLSRMIFKKYAGATLINGVRKASW